ncbi:magnesium transporter [Candidatus Woesearchaeota archaeon]|nr:magnesium transporter [Candidatus Woesearchaeota archaeon]
MKYLLQKLRRLERKKFHPLLHKIHKKHKISKRTLFYIKEYGPHSHVSKTIIKESIKILLLASLLSSFGGFAIENIKHILISILPLVILLPALNDMAGDYGVILSSKFSTMIHEGKIKKVKINKRVSKIFIQILIISVLMSLLTAVIALIISKFQNYPLSLSIIYKVFLISILDILLLVILLFTISIISGIYFYNKGEDPNNFLIPITTSLADFGNMIILTILILYLF